MDIPAASVKSYMSQVYQFCKMTWEVVSGVRGMPITHARKGIYAVQHDSDSLRLLICRKGSAAPLGPSLYKITAWSPILRALTSNLDRVVFYNLALLEWNARITTRPSPLR